MSTEPLRTLFCIGNNQNFFDLPKNEIGPVWVGISTMLTNLKHMDGVDVIGTFDDDATWSVRRMAGRGRVTCWPTCVTSRR